MRWENELDLRVTGPGPVSLARAFEGGGNVPDRAMEGVCDCGKHFCCRTVDELFWLSVGDKGVISGNQPTG